MTWFGWTAIAMTAASTLLNIARAGKPGAVTGEQLVWVVLINALLITGMLFVGTGRVS